MWGLIQNSDKKILKTLKKAITEKLKIKHNVLFIWKDITEWQRFMA